MPLSRHERKNMQLKKIAIVFLVVIMMFSLAAIGIAAEGAGSEFSLSAEFKSDKALSALKAGASVVHVDASKGMVQWARENAASSGVADKPVRWIVDDCMKFVAREIRREKKYDIIIMDPPSYGRGPGGEVWKLENEVYGFVEMCMEVLSDDALMVLINSYTTGLSPSVMEYILGETVQRKLGGTVSSDEIGIPVSSKPGRVLPCGASAIWKGNGVK